MPVTALLLGMMLAAGAAAEAAATPPPAAATRPSGALQPKVAPGLARYTDEVLFGEVWPSAGLSPRDRSLVVISALIATNKPAQLTGHLNRALTNGVTPVEASGVLTHLAFYAGWPNAVSALEVYDQVYTARKVDLSALQPHAAPAGDARAAPAGAASSKFDRLTRDVVFGDLWRRSDLAPRDRSLVTIAALAAMGEADQLTPYLRRGVEAGLTREEIAEAITHLAFYAGWPRAGEALQVVDGVLGQVATASRGVEIQRQGSSPARQGPAETFTGSVRITSPFRGRDPARVSGGMVSFEAGARTAWHAHPLGQTLVVIQGCGLVHGDGGPVQAIRPGDVVWIPPGVRHWHGASPTKPMSHVAITEALDGETVAWMEHVEDKTYREGADAAHC